MSTTTIIRPTVTEKEMTLKASVYKQSIVRYDNYEPVEKSQQYLRITFEFADDWDAARIASTKVAFWKGNDVEYVELDSDKTVVVPKDFIKAPGFLFSVISNVGAAATEMKVTTKAVFVPVQSEFGCFKRPDITEMKVPGDGYFSSLFIYDDETDDYMSIEDYILREETIVYEAFKIDVKAYIIQEVHRQIQIEVDDVLNTEV